MKRIALRSVPNRSGDDVMDYRNIVEQVIRQPLNRQAGATIDEMRKGIRVLDALDRAIGDAPLELEDADWEHLKAKVEVMPWAVVDRRILEFVDAVMYATDMPETRVNGLIATRN